MSASNPVMPSTNSMFPEDRHALALANSDRIQLIFGNYGIQVLENSPGMRISSLYSIHDGIKTNRTFAVVAYPEVIAEAIKKEHRTIIGGESIGIVFRNNGCETIKHHQYFGKLETPIEGSDTLSMLGATRPAIHIYWLSVMKNDSEYRYAQIAEVHHPDYLKLEDLQAIYGDEFNDKLQTSSDVSEMLKIVKRKMQTY